MIKKEYRKKYTAIELQDGDLFDFLQEEFEKEARSCLSIVEDFGWEMETDKDSHRTKAVIFIARGYNHE